MSPSTSALLGTDPVVFFESQRLYDMPELFHEGGVPEDAYEIPFGEPDVIIGGHTDSTGSENLNEHLSQQRADAVRQYFVANETLPYEKIIAVGYGSMRPIASNATQSGRAMNRRIDVLITPTPAP